MTMTMDSQQRHHLGMDFNHMSYSAGPHFTNPWPATTNSHSAQMYPTSNMNFEMHKQQSRPTTMTMPYSALPATAAPVHNATYAGMGYSQAELMAGSQPYDHSYSGAPAPSNVAYAPHNAYNMGSYGQSLAQQQQQQQQEHGRSMGPTSVPQSHQAFGEALESARGMVAMSQDITPRNIYGPRAGRESTDSYGFPATHSSQSSISSASSYPQYFGSVDSSVTDYSSSSEMEPMNSRTLPRPTGLIGGNMPPAPQSMMGSFNSKVSSSTQKKHKCKVCDKRFTRPSSLQTHMYSHTGEKPFACEVPGCGRNFSVVSNLRRHRKVHKGEPASDHGSPEGSWMSSSER